MCRISKLSTDCKSCTMLTSVHSDADVADDANNYNRVIGIALLKAFSCAKNHHILFSFFHDHFLVPS